MEKRRKGEREWHLALYGSLCLDVGIVQIVEIVEIVEIVGIVGIVGIVRIVQIVEIVGIVWTFMNLFALRSYARMCLL